MTPLPPAFFLLLKMWAQRGFTEIGFTGTQRGMTLGQMASFVQIAGHIQSSVPKWRFHHGDCLGADAEAHDIAKGAGAVVVIHPGTDDQGKSPNRAHCVGHETLPAWPYLLRNKDIVNAVELLVAAPATVSEVVRSGTWATIRYARGKSKNLVTLSPEPSTLRRS